MIVYENINARVLIEKLLLKRNTHDYQAYVETFRESLIDVNPHQVEAIVFALEKLENGGCILADEVGLGKTIEAGLVIAQYRAKRHNRVLIIVPTSLAGQWSNELRRLFQIPSHIITSRDKKRGKKDGWKNVFEPHGVYILGREFAARLEREKNLSKKKWDLIVVDEAHEVFANIYKRFNSRDGFYNPKSKESATAGDMFDLLKRSPVMLLTATPIQNNIFELWGLSSFILPERNKSHLGKFNHFKDLFVRNGEIVEDKMPELQERLSNFLVRNLRRNAQDFMKYKFTDRNCETLNFNMGEEEKEIYNTISNYLERDDIYAYSGGSIDINDDRRAGIRNLLKMSYRKMLGSSFEALKKSLHGIIERLEKMKTGQWVYPKSSITTDDWENDEEDHQSFNVHLPEEVEKPVVFTPTETDIRQIEAEIEQVRSFIRQADELQITGKDKILIPWLKNILDMPDRFSGKAVIFTTYTSTQQHLLKILEENGFENEVLLFSGNNHRSAKEKDDLDRALECWHEEVGPSVSPSEQPTGTILERTALVHYFKSRKKIFVSTEAGAKGLNLQFCNVIINYDLPWNPQRIEQRIGRCHRYGQTRDVLVINCINADNETEQRIYNILENKFNLFKSLMGAGDDILGTLSKAFNFEARVHDIFNKLKTKEERQIWLTRLEEEIDEKKKELIDQKLKKTRSLLDDLDPHVKTKLKSIEEEMPESFSRYDKDMLELMRCIAAIHGIRFEELEKNQEQLYFLFDNKNFYIGKRDEENIRNYEHMHLKHPMLEQWVQKLRTDRFPDHIRVGIDYSLAPGASDILKPYSGSRGRWDVYRVGYNGLDEEERLYDIVAVNNGLKFLEPDEIDTLHHLPFSLLPEETSEPFIDENSMLNYLNRKITEDKTRIMEQQKPRINKEIHNLEVELMDMEEYLRKEETDIQANLAELDKKIGSTFDSETGNKLLDQKRKLKNDLNRCRNDLLEFQNTFYKSKNDKELEIEAKRFVQADPVKILSFYFYIR
ncbi:MAG: SNF2-related protein [Candidatus Omnitrophota bacterium]